MKCYVCHTTRPLAGGLWPTAHQAVAICQHCGAGVCATHLRRADTVGSTIYCEDCRAVVVAAEANAAPVATSTLARVGASFAGAA